MAIRCPEDTITRWFRRSGGRTRASHNTAEAELQLPDSAPAPFVCTTCGRTDLPEVGGWDPPICQECDAAINEDAMYEAAVEDA